MPAHASPTIRDEVRAIYRNRIVIVWWLAVRGIEPERSKQLAAVGCVMGGRCHQADAAIPLFPAQRDHVVHYGVA